MAFEYFPLHDPAIKALKNLCDTIACNKRAYKSHLCREHYREKYGPISDGIDYIYAVAGAGKIKIGITKAPEKRLSSLQTGSPVPLEMLGYIVGNKNLEDAIHNYLSEHRSHGEWFDVKPKTTQVVDLIVGNELDELRALVEPRVGLTLKQMIRKIDEDAQLEYQQGHV